MKMDFPVRQGFHQHIEQTDVTGHSLRQNRGLAWAKGLLWLLPVAGVGYFLTTVSATALLIIGLAVVAFFVLLSWVCFASMDGPIL